MGAINVSGLPAGESSVPGFAGSATRWEEKKAQVRWLTRPAGFNLMMMMMMMMITTDGGRGIRTGV